MLSPEEIESLFAAETVSRLLGLGAPFQIDGVVYDAEAKSATVSWNTRSGRIYAIEVSADLQIWVELDDGLIGDGQLLSFTEDAPPNSSGRYFRIKEVR